MAQPLSGTSVHYVHRNELSDRCRDILDESELFVVDLPEREGTKEKFGTSRAELLAAIDGFDGALLGTLVVQVPVLVEKLAVFRRAIIKYAVADVLLPGLCDRINEVRNDVCLFGDSLSVKFPPGPSILSDDDRKRHELANAFGADASRFLEPSGVLNGITKFLRDEHQLKEMKTKLESPRAVVQLAES